MFILKARFLTFFSFFLCFLTCPNLQVYGHSGEASLTAHFQVEDGEVLPGVEVELSGNGIIKKSRTDSRGNVNFRALPPGAYKLKAEYVGFESVYDGNLLFAASRHYAKEYTLVPGVLGCTNLWVVPFFNWFFDEKQHASADPFVLRKLPQAGDVWDLLQTIPGMQIDRLSIGGNQSQKKGVVRGFGDDGTGVRWQLEGIDISDPFEQGLSQSFLDFGALAGFSAKTNGNHVAASGNGPQLNFYMPRGTNTHKGSLRLLFSDRDFNSSHSFQAGDGSEIAHYFQRGIELGGPLIKDRFWYWGAFQQTDLETQRSGNESPQDLEVGSVKLHGQLSNQTRAELFFSQSNQQTGNVLPSPGAAPEAVITRRSRVPVFKVEINQALGQHTDLQLLYGRVDGGWSLSPAVSPNDAQPIFSSTTGVWEHSYRDQTSQRPTRQYQLSGVTSLGGKQVQHEFHYGFQYKKAWESTAESWGSEGTNIWVDENAQAGSSSYFYAARDRKAGTELQSTSAWVQNTLTVGRLSVITGLRYNRSDSQNLPVEIAPNPVFPEIVPSISYGGDDPAFEYSSFATQIEASYSFGHSQQFMVSTSFRRYFDEIGLTEARFANPVERAWITGLAQDFDGNGQYDQSELGFARDDQGNVIPYRGNEATQDPSRFRSVGLNLFDPRFIPPDRIDSNLKPPRTDEWRVAGSADFFDLWRVSLKWVHRERQDTHWVRTSLGEGRFLNGNDFQQRYLLTGTHPESGDRWEVPYYGLTDEAEALLIRFGRKELSNRPGYSERFEGWTLGFEKRLSDGWMFAGHVAYQDWIREADQIGISNPTPDATQSNLNGSDILITSAGENSQFGNFPGSAQWSGNVSGWMSLFAKTYVSGTFYARQGYQAPTFIFLNGAPYQAGGQSVRVVSINGDFQARNQNLYNLNLKFGKAFRVASLDLDLALEVFNVLNADAVLQANGRFGTHTNNDDLVQNFDDPTIGRIDPLFRQPQVYQPPRVFRLSLSVRY